MKKKTAQRKKSQVKLRTRKNNKKTSLKAIGLGFIILIAATVAVIASDQQAKTEHDLSVVGNGKATMVQIHDPKCQLCQRLQRVVGNVKGEFSDQVQFRTANIMTDKGKQFANRYNVPHVTLLFFDQRGKHVNTLRGVSSKQVVQAALQELVAQ